VRDGADAATAIVALVLLQRWGAAPIIVVLICVVVSLSRTLL
jgi:hypothetical protein